MRHLVVVHAGFTDYKPLAKDEMDGLETLAASIHETLGNCRSRVISSTAAPTIHAAEIIAKRLNLPTIHGEKFLWTGPYSPFGFPLDTTKVHLLDIVFRHSEATDGLVVVGHDEVCRILPDYYVHDMMRLEYELKPLSPGQAVHIDLDERVFGYLPKKPAS